MSTISLGPWPLGVDNVHAPAHRVFQVPGQGQPPARLREATNVLLDDEGWPTARPGIATRMELASGRHLIVESGLTIVQDGTILMANGVVVARGLVRPITHVRHGEWVYWSDGAQCGRLSSQGVASPWGCEIGPRPRVTLGTGSLPAGEYLLLAAYVDALGVEHASGEAVAVTLSSPGGLRVQVSVSEVATVAVRLWLAGPDDDRFYLLGDTPSGAFPVLVSALPDNDSQCWTAGLGLSPPMPADVLIAFRDSLVLGVGPWLYPSVGAATHLYDLNVDHARLPEDVVAGAGLLDGVWVVTQRDAYWISGEKPAEWKVVPQRLGGGFAAGSLVINSGLLPGLGLNTPALVALFMSQWGLAIGLPGGVMLLPMRGRYHAEVVGKRASFAYTEIGSAQQFLVALS